MATAPAPLHRLRVHNLRRFLGTLLIAALGLLFIADVWCGVRMNRLAVKRATLKRDYSKVNDIEYGLLSVNAWRDALVRIASNRIRDFTLTGKEQATLQKELTNVINSLITTADSIVQRSGKSLGGKIKRAAINIFINWDKLHRQAPVFARAAVQELNKPKNRESLKNLAIEKIDQYAAITHQTGGSGTDTTVVPRILAAYRQTSVEEFNESMMRRIDRMQRRTYHYTFVLVGSMMLFLLVWLRVLQRLPELRRPLFNLSVALGLVALLVSLVSPMIEIDARIKRLDFLLLGEHLRFNDQVIFYQSKSILDVIRILLATGKPDSMLVGVLILAFSMLFPIAKLIATEVYLVGGAKVKRNRFVNFFAFHSGKWSMADVAVVAIFMAYIGFRGILQNQLTNLNFKTPTVTSITTNLTSLQPGYILFVAFVLYGLLLSVILERITHRTTPGKPET